MKWAVVFLIASACLFSEESRMSQDETRMQIKKLQEEIQIHENRARFASREAMRLWPIDLTTSRRYLLMQQKNEEKADQLRQELERLQTQQQK